MPRPRLFDTNAVLDQLCDYFWEHGYGGTSLDELAKLLMESKFDQRVLIRGMAASKAYNLTSQLSHPTQKEPRTFARMNLKGLSGLQIYDSFGFEMGPGFLLPSGKAIFFGATGHNAIYTPTGSTAPVM